MKEPRKTYPDWDSLIIHLVKEDASVIKIQMHRQDMENLQDLHFTERKDIIELMQSIGRGMRLYEGKERVNIIDFVDDFSLPRGSKNHLLRHGEERIKIYTEQGFPHKIYKVSL